MQSDQSWPRGLNWWNVRIAMILLCTAGVAYGQEDQLACDQAAAIAAENSEVPLEVLLAITRVETGRSKDGQLVPWPWSINLDGKGYWFDDIDQALAFAGQQLEQGVENFDVGCFQINLRWHGAEFSSLANAFDPSSNAAYAAKFLSQLYAEKGDWAQAVAAYHSRTPEFAAVYVQKVQDVAAGLKPYSAEINSIPVATAARLNRFPLLQAGLSAGVGSIVPLIDAATPLIGGF